MPERRVRVGSKVGLHARPAALFVQAAARQPVPVWIAKDGVDPVDARSICRSSPSTPAAATRWCYPPKVQARTLPSTNWSPWSAATWTRRSDAMRQLLGIG